MKAWESETFAGVVGFPREPGLPGPLGSSRAPLVQIVVPGVRRPPRVLVEEGHALVRRAYLVRGFKAIVGELVRERVQGLGGLYIGLGAAVEAERARP